MTLSDLNNLSFNEIGSWPLAARALLLGFVALIIAGGGYWFHVKDLLAELDSRQTQETQLRQEFQEKQAIAANLDAYRARLEQLEELLDELVRQLPE